MAPSPSIDLGESTRALEMLVAIADHGTFTAAADRLGLTPSAISKAVARMEARLGTRLVQRTTRRMALTDLGVTYVTRGRRLLAELSDLEREVSARQGAVRGVLRVSAPAVYGAIRVAPLLLALQRKHPELELHLRCEDRTIDMVAERIDIAVRVLATPPAEMVARVIGEDRRGLFASTSYLRRAATPVASGDLRAHALIAYSGGSDVLRRTGGRIVFATDSLPAAREAACAGNGIAELPEYLVADDVAAGRLREVVPGVVPVTRRVYAVYLPSPYLPAPIRAGVDALVGRRRRGAASHVGG